ncbi:hypothetical protein OJ253_3039 [Cryptosporidium canis]|uniref:DDH domain-containing protein n=1 Tax=Cryptosporidium canis TaxID=195482 RepID=A0A9D5DH90_9CRYT|nr:hypothetical protein OJ253_3039 [Cryptosporidium canis]
MDLELSRYYSDLVGESGIGGNCVVNGKTMYNLVIGNRSADLDSIISAITYSRILNLTNNAINFDDDNKICGLHLPIISCNQGDLKLKFPLISLIGHFSASSSKSGGHLQIDSIPFICLDHEIFSQTVREMEGMHENSGHYITLVDHNVLDAFQDNSLSGRVVSIVDHHQDSMTTESKFRLSLGTKIGSCSTLIGSIWRDSFDKGKIDREILIENKVFLEMIICTILKDTCNFDQKLFGERWSSLDFEIYKWILDKLSIEDSTNNKYTDFYKNHLKYANRNMDLILRNNLMDLFKMDYKEFVYQDQTGAREVITGYSSFEIDILKMANHYKMESFQSNIIKFMACNKLDLFIILSNYIEKTGNQEEKVSKQLAISSSFPDPRQDILNLVIEYLESNIKITEIDPNDSTPEIHTNQNINS